MAQPQRSASTETATASPYPHPYLIPRPGRPSLYNPERTAAICAIIRAEGISDSAAGALAGVTASTLSRWKLEHEEFALELEVARALFEVDQVRAIRDARKRDGSVDWRAAAWLLKHSSPEGYGPASRRRKVKAVEDDGQVTEGAQREQERAMDAFLPKTPRDGSGPGERPEGAAVMADKNCANLPETAGVPLESGAPAAARPSRRDRRAEERRLAKAARTSLKEAA
jgi:hypothetical protein